MFYCYFNFEFFLGLVTSYMLFVLGFVYCAVNENRFDIVCEESGTMKQFTLLEMWKLHAVLPAIHAG